MEKTSLVSHLQGEWTNEISSSLSIKEVSADGSFRGVYKTVVGKTDGKEYGVVGFFSENAQCPNSILVSFIVNWNDVHALTTWNGYLKVDGNEKSISTTWLHTKSTKEVRFWDGLTTGSNVFVPKK